MTPSEFLAAARSAYPALPADVLHRDFRQEVARELCSDFSAADRELARYLLAQEIDAHARDEFATIDDLKRCAYPLFVLGRLEDVLLLWQAKSTSFDAYCGFDIQLLVGAGVEPTIAYLRQEATATALAAAEYIESCRAAGDFDWLDEYRADLLPSLLA